MKFKLLGMVTLLILFLAACSSEQTDTSMDGMEGMDTKNNSAETKENESKNIPQTEDPIVLKEDDNEFTIVAKEAKHSLTKEVSVNAWTFNGSVPGSQIRVKQGEEVKITLKNELPKPVTIHWHGITVKNEMDGIPGITQNAVQPGESFTYTFTPEDPGTYMYHTHQNGVKQMDKGLAGSFIVEPKKTEELDRDYTLVLDEWMSNSESSMMEDMEGMSMDEEENEENAEMGHSMDAYDIFTINGKSGEEIKPLMVTEGDKVRIRLVNVGFMSHKIHLHGHDFKVVAVDGQKINKPEKITDELISIAPGERYDIEFTADNPGEWYLECHGDMEGTKGMKTQIKYENATKSEDKSNQAESLTIFDYTTYGEKSKSKFTLDQKFDVEYTMDLNTAMQDHEMVYTINDKTFPNTENIQVDKGDLVKVTLKNNSESDDHPMHLHGHFFQILSKNGQPIKGSPIIKDTVNLKPGDEYVIAFEADNPGDWLFHCHDLHHASAGMMNLVKYNGFEPKFEVDPNANNKPE